MWREYRDNVIEARREQVRAVLRRGIADGEIDAGWDVELLEDLFTGPMLVRSILHAWQPLSEDLPERIVDAVLGRAPRS
ncbi:TetR-like C-terminal domain-containing protein [Streptomyces sp. M19]